MRKTLRQLMQESDRCIFAPCVYDCSSARAMEMAGYEALMFSSGEYSLAGSGVVDYGFSGLSDLEWMVGRITATCSLPLAVDIEDGFGGPLAVYRTCKRLARLGAAAVQLEDAGDMEETTGLMPREQYYAKVRAALEALEGTDTEAIKRATELLTEKSYEVFGKIYQQQQQQGQGQQPPHDPNDGTSYGPNEGGDDNVVDADYEVVK